MPEELGDLRLLRLLGRGGMGSVWLAEHRETGGRYAVKVVETDQADVLLRFQREVEAQAAVDRHPNVGRVHSAGHVGARSFAVLELLEGGDLQQRLRAGPLAPEEVRALGRDLARGLAHVHARGILHRDLKPSNVLFDAQGTPKLVDFGLARIEGAASLTESGTILGTPAYMAPEQVDGRADVRSDVYGLGALLFHALVGRPPFVGPTVLAVLARSQREAAPRASALRPGVPTALDDLLVRTLARDPAGRFADAATLADALERLELDPPVRRRGAALAGLAALAAPALATLLLRPAAPPVEPPAEPPAPVASSPVVTRAQSPLPVASTSAVDSVAWPADVGSPVEAWVVRAGDEFAAGFKGSRFVRRWRLEAAGPRPLEPLELPAPSASAAASGAAGRLVVGVDGGVSELGDAGFGKAVEPGPRNAPRELAVSPHGEVAAAWLAQVRVLGREEPWAFQEDSIGGVRWCDDARLLVVGWSGQRPEARGWLRLCTVGRKRPETVLEVTTGPFHAVLVDPRRRGRFFVAGTELEVKGQQPGGVVFMGDLEARTLVPFATSTSRVLALALLEDGLLSVTGEGDLQRWWDDGAGPPRLVGALATGQAARTVAVSRDGQWVAVGHLGREGPAVTFWRLDQVR